jgi:phenylacetate-coenzyme A ligase PaaK-like adenylate-forming protein
MITPVGVEVQRPRVSEGYNIEQYIKREMENRKIEIEIEIENRKEQMENIQREFKKMCKDPEVIKNWEAQQFCPPNE